MFVTFIPHISMSNRRHGYVQVAMHSHVKRSSNKIYFAKEKKRRDALKAVCSLVITIMAPCTAKYMRTPTHTNTEQCTQKTITSLLKDQ